MSYEDSEEQNENYSSNSKSEYYYSVKFIIVGDSSVGKSNILLRFSRNVFDPLNHFYFLLKLIGLFLVPNLCNL